MDRARLVARDIVVPGCPHEDRVRTDGDGAAETIVRLAGVVDLALNTDEGFGKDPRVGPWAPVIRSDPEFAATYAALDVNRYKLIVAAMPRTLLDRDTAPGAEPEDLLQLDIPALIVPGKDVAHATSAARYLEECLPGSEYWDILPAEQTEDNVPDRLIEFLDRVSASA